MKERDSLLKKVQMYQFCLFDIHLYLDSHPFCKEALEYYKKYSELSKEANREYTEKFGPLNHSDVDVSHHWTWVDGPWPWEMED